MKAVILEIIKERAVVMKEDGTVRRVRNRNYSVGDEIYMKEGIFSHRKWAPIVAALLIFAMVGTGTWAYATPAYEVSIIEEEGSEFIIKVNRFGKITEIIKDDKEIDLEDEDWKIDDLDEFLQDFFVEFKLDSEKTVSVTTIGKDKEASERVAADIEEKVLNMRAQAAHERNEVRKQASEEIVVEDEEDPVEENIRVKGLSPEEVEWAKNNDITPGKYNIITNLLNTDETDDEFDEYLEKSNQELMRIFTAEKGEKNGVKFQEDADKEKKEKDIPLGQLKEKTVVEFEELDDDLEEDDDDDDDTDESIRPKSPGKSDDAPGKNKNN